MIGQVYYKATMDLDPAGIIVLIHRYVSIHESEQTAYCVIERDSGSLKALSSAKETMLQTAKRLGRKIVIVRKSCSRQLFETEELAYKNLQYRKRKHEAHLRRSLAMVSKFNEVNLDLKQMGKSNYCRYSGIYARVIPNTEELVAEHYNFD